MREATSHVCMFHQGGCLSKSSGHDSGGGWWWISCLWDEVDWKADERRRAPGSPWNQPSFYFAAKRALAVVMLADRRSRPILGLQHIRVQDGSVPDKGSDFGVAWRGSGVSTPSQGVSSMMISGYLSPPLSTRQNKTRIFLNTQMTFCHGVCVVRLKVRFKRRTHHFPAKCGKNPTLDHRFARPNREASVHDLAILEKQKI